MTLRSEFDLSKVEKEKKRIIATLKTKNSKLSAKKTINHEIIDK